MEAAPVIIAEEATSTSSVHRRPYRSTPIWRQPAVLGTTGALVVFGVVGYLLMSSGKLPKNDRTTNAPNPNTEHVAASTRPPDDVAAAEISESDTAASVSTPADVEPPVAPPSSSQADLVIDQAAWGGGDKWLGVTQAVRGLVADNRLMMMVWTNLAGATLLSPHPDDRLFLATPREAQGGNVSGSG